MKQGNRLHVVRSELPVITIQFMKQGNRLHVVRSELPVTTIQFPEA